MVLTAPYFATAKGMHAMETITKYVKAHMASISSWSAVVLTLISVSLASDLIPTGSSLYHVLGYVGAVLTALGFKALPAPGSPTVTTN
jgi:hypothetical protein